MNATTTVASIPASGEAATVEKIPLVAPLPPRPRTRSQTSPTPRSFHTVPASPPVRSPTKIHVANVSRVIEFPLPLGTRPPPAPLQIALDLDRYHVINYITSREYITMKPRWRAGRHRRDGMFTEKTRVLLILSQDILDRARVCAGRATATLKLPVSLQIVLRALIEEGLKRDDHPALLANVEGQAKAVRHKRSMARREGAAGERRSLRSGTPRAPSGRGRRRRRK